MPRWTNRRAIFFSSLVSIFLVSYLHAADTKKILDQFETYEDLQDALKKSNIEGCNLIVAVDFTKSNLERGQKTYAKNFTDPNEIKFFSNLHWIHDKFQNPYTQVIRILAKTLAPFDDDQIFPLIGFGDNQTRADKVMRIKVAEKDPHGIEQVIQAYSDTVKTITMSGPTSFAPTIREALDIVYHDNASYHILVIITDGEISEGLEEENYQALMKASLYPLSIIGIGVGDGDNGFSAMKGFDDQVKDRLFDNFQFVEFSKIMDGMSSDQQIEVKFSGKALAEIPEQYKRIKKYGMLNPNYRDNTLMPIHKIGDHELIKSALAQVKNPPKSKRNPPSVRRHTMPSKKKTDDKKSEEKKRKSKRHS